MLMKSDILYGLGMLALFGGMLYAPDVYLGLFLFVVFCVLLWARASLFQVQRRSAELRAELAALAIRQAAYQELLKRRRK